MSKPGGKQVGGNSLGECRGTALFLHTVLYKKVYMALFTYQVFVIEKKLSPRQNHSPSIFVTYMCCSSPVLGGLRHVTFVTPFDGHLALICPTFTTQMQY